MYLSGECKVVLLKRVGTGITVAGSTWRAPWGLQITENMFAFIDYDGEVVTESGEVERRAQSHKIRMATKGTPKQIIYAIEQDQGGADYEVIEVDDQENGYRWFIKTWDRVEVYVYARWADVSAIDGCRSGSTIARLNERSQKKLIELLDAFRETPEFKAATSTVAQAINAQ